MKNFLRFLLIPAIMIVAGQAFAEKEKAPGYTVITAEQLQTLIKEKKDLVIIDSRGGKWGTSINSLFEA